MEINCVASMLRGLSGTGVLACWPRGGEAGCARPGRRGRWPHLGCFVAVIAIACLAGATLAAEIVVSPVAGEPVLANALRAVADGDVIRMKKGVYQETVVIKNRVSVVGEAGAIIDPSESFAPQWQSAAAIGKGVYQAAVKQKPRALFLDGKVVAEIDERRTGTEDPWFWKTLVASGPPRGGFKFIRAIWMYRSSDKTVYIHLSGDVDPATLHWTAIWKADPVIAFRGAAGASVSGVTIAHGFTGVAFLDQARQCSVSGCVIGPWEKVGVLLSSGATGCLVEKNEVFRGAYEDWAPGDGSRERYEVWQIHKLAGFYDRVGIDLIRAGADNRIHGNHVFETFDGIDIGDSDVESLDKLLPHPKDGKGTEIWENLIERTRDSGMELGGGCIDVRVHDNMLRQTHGGLRFKLPRVGPVFIYRNVLEGGVPFNIWYSMDDSPAEGYVYHNTIVGGRAGLMYSSFNKGHQIGAPKWHYVNNLVVAERGFFRNSNVDAPVNFTADYNVVAGGGKPWPDDLKKDTHSRYVEKLPLGADFRPGSDSPAIGAGLDLSTYFHGGPLPGCSPGYFKGKAPDAGAFETR